MKKTKRIIAVLFVVIFTLTSLSFNVYGSESSMVNFVKTKSYPPGLFPDISENEWFGYNKQRSVSTAYELGLMQGKGLMFDPHGVVTLAEAITIAARLNNIYNGVDWDFYNTSPWYNTYLEYATSNNIIQSDTFNEYTRPATRAEVAYLLGRSIPEAEFAPINSVNELPDVNTNTLYHSYIFMLYNAGILTGNDTYGTFGPNDSITRAQVAAIITRIAFPTERVTFTLTPKKEEPSDEAEQAVEEEPLSVIPVWGKVYSPGMSVKTKDELLDLLDAAFKNLIPQFEILLDNAVYDEYQNDPDFLAEYRATTHSYYDYQTKEFSINIEYPLFHQMQGLIFNRKAVEQYVSSQVRDYDAQMSSMLAKIITPGMTDRQKVKAVHDYMVVNYKYDIDFESELYGMDTYSFQGLLKNGTGVCQAYAELFFLFMCYVDIECYYVGGWADGGTGKYELHAWNVVYVDDGYYHVDVTFDDPVPDQGNKISYDYFLKTDNQMAKDHDW